MAKRFVAAMIKHETNTFSPIPTPLASFAVGYPSGRPPVGKSAMQKFGAYMADIMPVVQAEIMKAASKMKN